MTDNIFPQGDDFWSFLQWAGSVVFATFVAIWGWWQWMSKQIWTINKLQSDLSELQKVNEKAHDQLWQVLSQQRIDLDHFKEIVATKLDMGNMEQRLFNKIELVVDLLRGRVRDE